MIEKADLQSTNSLEGIRVLVVEDGALIAMEAQIILEEQGMKVIGPAAAIEQAKALLHDQNIDMAFLDIDINGSFVWPIADILIERNIPFAFATGYESATTMPSKFSKKPLLAKPYRAQELVTMANKLSASAPSKIQ
ncbi:MAG: response regulator [Pseudomonadota bacterium]